MLNPNNDRLDYGRIIAPPVSCQLDFAVGTTYSLDLDALVGVCIALGLSEETDSVLMKNPICLLEALRSTGDKVALFCEGGQIHTPNAVTPLYVLLEKMVFQVKTAKKKGIAHYPSFHPKFWLIRYVDEKGEPIYRIVILSRNLTFDRSWDITFCMDGKKKKVKTNKNNPVADFLNYLIKDLPDNENSDNKRNKIKSIIKELSNIYFELNSKEFSDYEFLPVGISNKHTILNTPLFTDTYHELLIMSPFLSNGVIKEFNERSRYMNHAEHTLITRAKSLENLKPEDCSNFDIYTIKDAVVDGETAISEDEQQIKRQDIHAKVYMTRKYYASDLYLGSLNASHNAIRGNVEFMIRLSSQNRYLNLAKLKKSLFNGDEDNPDNPFQRVDISRFANTKQTDDGVDLSGIIKDIIRTEPCAIVEPNGEHYDLIINFGKIESDYTINISPLLSNKTEILSETVVFKNLSVSQLSEFYKVSVNHCEKKIERVVIIPTSGIPENRDKTIISSVISNKSSFYSYISLLLGDSYVLNAMELENNNSSLGGNSSKTRASVGPAIYEKMLYTASTNPERFKDIDYLIKSVSDDGVIPEDFEALYNDFKKVVKFNG